MQGSSQKDSGELDIIWVVVGILLVVGIVFFLFRSYILTGILWIKYFELHLISAFVVNDKYRGLENWAHHSSAHSNSIRFTELRLLALEVGESLKYPCMLLCLFLAGLVFWKHPQSGYRDIESMKSLAAKVKKVFPAINIISGLDLIKASVDKGQWAMADTPIEFAKKNKLIYKERKTGKIVVDQNKANLVFSKQLGGHWPGVDALPPYQKALFAIFAAFANFQRDEAETKMEEIAMSLTPDQVKTGKIKFEIDEMLQKYKDTPAVKKIIKNHAYTNTIFMEMLTAARQSGIVLNSLYLWLKPLDRGLWYILNNVGRKAVFSEGAAVQAHWLAERRLGFAISQPMIDEAALALQEAIDSRIIKDI